MRVLLVNSHGTDLTVGGAERYADDLASGMRARGIKTFVLSAFPMRRAVAGIPSATLHSRDWRTSSRRRLQNHVGDVLAVPGARLGRIVAAFQPDLVHTSNLQGLSTAVWESARRVGAAVVHTLHDYHLICPRTTLLRPDSAPCDPHPLLCGLRAKRLARWAAAVKHVIAGSEHLLQTHRGVFPAAAEHVVRLPLRAIARELPPPESPLRTIGYVGALASLKGVRVLLEAATALTQHDLTLRVAGDGPLRGEVEAAAAVGVLRYDGFLEGERKLDFLAACDVGVVPSVWNEPSGPPYVVCEWLAASRPVLASRRGGLAEAAAALGGVLQLEPTAAGVVDAVLALQRDREWRRALSAVPLIDGATDVERWLDDHEAIYRAAVGER
jgi:glycosyltransferase involved in cell wall biosynthesis